MGRCPLIDPLIRLKGQPWEIQEQGKVHNWYQRGNRQDRTFDKNHATQRIERVIAR